VAEHKMTNITNNMWCQNRGLKTNNSTQLYTVYETVCKYQQMIKTPTQRKLKKLMRNTIISNDIRNTEIEINRLYIRRSANCKRERKHKNLWLEIIQNFILYAAQFAVLHAEYLEKFKVDLHVLKGGYTVFQKYRSKFKTLYVRRMDRRNKYSEDPQIL